MISVIKYKGDSKTFRVQLVSSTVDWELVEVKDVNRGIAYNKAIGQVRGEYVLFLDEKDWANETIFPEIARGNLDEDFLIFDFVCHYPDGKVEYRMPNTYHVPVQALLKATIVDDYPAQLSNKLFKKSVIMSNGISFQEELDCYGEALFFISVLRHSKKYRYVDKPLVHIQTELQWGTMEYSMGRYLSFCRFYRSLAGTMGKAETEAVNLKVFRTKVDFMAHSLLDTRSFNRQIETPLHLFWSSNWSFVRKLKYTGMFFFSKFER